MVDIPLLAKHYLDAFCCDLNKAPIAIPDTCMEALMSYDWPGNVRELANCLERAAILCDDVRLDESQLGLGGDREASPATTFDLSGTLADVSRRASSAAESEKVRQVLDEVGGDRRRAAELLSVSKKTLLHKMRDFGLAEKANETKVVPPSGRE